MKRFARLSGRGFTVIELLVFITILTIIAIVAITNIRTIRAENRDQARKTDINTLYYQLESFFETNTYYPKNLNQATLPGVNPEILEDSKNIKIGAEGSEYSYSPDDCNQDQCESYVLQTKLEREADFVKESL